jgi:hypothetical protein
MIPYNYLLGHGHDHDGRFIEVLESRLRRLLRPILMTVEMDEAWYLKLNDDVDREIKAGNVLSARDHYADAGYFEDRLPRPIVVDEAWYLKTYPDVAEAILTRKSESAQQHFDVNGFKEGRLPFAGWSLLADKVRPLKALHAVAR